MLVPFRSYFRVQATAYSRKCQYLIILNLNARIRAPDAERKSEELIQLKVGHLFATDFYLAFDYARLRQPSS